MLDDLEEDIRIALRRDGRPQRVAIIVSFQIKSALFQFKLTPYGNWSFDLGLNEENSVQNPHHRREKLSL
jgi:hypothetical protein